MEFARVCIQDIGLSYSVMLLRFFCLNAGGFDVLMIFPIGESHLRTVRGAVDITKLVRPEHLYTSAGELCESLAVRMTVAVIFAA